MNSFRGELTGISAKTEALFRTVYSLLDPTPVGFMLTLAYLPMLQCYNLNVQVSLDKSDALVANNASGLSRIRV